MANKLHRQVKGLSEDKSDKLNLISGNLGISLDGQKTVEVSNRDGYVWVRLRGNQSELIQAYNSAVSPIFDLPVLVVRSNNRYAVYGRDIEKYGDWGNSPYLPKHGTQHSFNPDLGMGGDVTWIYSRQFVPLLAMPSGSAGAASLVVNPHIYREPSDGSFTYIGNQGTPDATLAKPTDNQARMMLLYWDLNTNLPNMITGSLFDATITGTAQITPYIPALNDSEKIPLSAIRVVSGTTTIDWDNIYDIRQFATTTPPAFQGGFGIWDEGVPQGTGTILNFIGAGIDATVSGTVAQIVVTATGGGGTSSPWTTGSAGTNSIKAIGGGSNATGDYAVAHGQDTTATGTASTAEGIDSVARGDYSHAEGNGTLARGDESHAEGYQTVAIGLDSHAEGQSSISSGTASHAEGQNNIAIGFGSHAGGVANIARGDYSSTNGGIGNRAAGQSSAALGGSENIVTGTNSATIGGVSNILLGQRSAIVGGQGITGTASDTAYMDYANVRTLNSGTAVSNVGINSQGFLVTGSSVSIREVLSANRTYYVRTDGNDSNDGLADTSGGAWLTLQGAYDNIKNSIDFGGYTVTIQIGDGTYTAGVTINGWVGGGILIYKGNSSTPSNVLVSTTSASCFVASSIEGVLRIQDLEMRTTTSGHCVTSNANGNIQVGAVAFGACAGYHVLPDGTGARITMFSNYTINGGAVGHWLMQYGAQVVCVGKTITLTGTPAFSAAFLQNITGIARVNANTFSGSATGTRYSITLNGAVFTNGAGATYLPGDVGGTTATGGQYA